MQGAATMEDPTGKKEIKFFKLKKFIYLKNNRGQFAIEAVLLSAILIGGFVAATSLIKKNNYISKLFTGPMKAVKNMAEYGTWKSACTGYSAKPTRATQGRCHPNSSLRALSSNPN